MPRFEYNNEKIRITHTIEETGPHPTLQYDFYENTFTITIVIRGKGTCYIEGDNYPLDDGSIVVCSPDDIHSFRFSQDGYHERVSIYFSGALLSGFAEHQLSLLRIFRDFNTKKKRVYQKDCYNQDVMSQILDELCAVIKEDRMDMKDARIHVIFLRLLFILYDCSQTNSDSCQNDSQNSVISEICTYIKDHLNEQLSYKEIENRFFVSRYQLTSKFQHYVGMTLTEYVIQRRLLNVASMVRNGSGIETAAYASGFNTYSHFYKEFLKYFHTSPKIYFSINKE